MKKLTFIVVALLVLLTAGSLAAQEPVTLTYMASQGWVPDAEIELGARFEEETGIHVDYQIVPSDQYFTLLQTRLNTGEATDIYGGQSGVTDLIVNYNVEANAVDLSGEAWVARMDPLVLAQATVNGKVYGLTLWDVTGTTWVVNYNKTIFEENNLSVPSTYAEFKSVCETLLGTDVIPVFEPVASGWHHVLWFPELGPRYEEATPGLAAMLNANEATFADDPTMLAVVEQLNELYELGCFGDNALADTTEFTTEALATGQYAMALTNLTGPQAVVQDYPEVSADSFGFFVMPLADNQNLNINPSRADQVHLFWLGTHRRGKAVLRLPDAPRESAIPHRQQPGHAHAPLRRVGSEPSAQPAGIPGVIPGRAPRHGLPDRRELCQSAVDGYRSGPDRNVHWRYRAGRSSGED
ncbi:MAG: carbohydrate ABC transporter substrate-binding protein [Chloroflexi bacterium]|nr:carbohydrate ABC transporter substrate-binding protein [Chloroflexota bacterium]